MRTTFINSTTKCASGSATEMYVMFVLSFLASGFTPFPPTHAPSFPQLNKVNALTPVKLPAMSTFSPIGLWSSNGMSVCVCVCVCVDKMNMKYALHQHIHISAVHSVLYVSATHKNMCTHILKLFEDSEPTGLKVDIAKLPASWVVPLRHMSCQCSLLSSRFTPPPLHSLSLHPSLSQSQHFLSNCLHLG